MATATLKRGDAIVWLPARSEVSRGLGTEPHLLALRPGVAARGGFERVSLEALAGTRRVRLIFDARDVTLLTPQVPALSGSRLMQALPNVIEDALLQDVAACAVVPGPALDDGRRVVAVIDRDWLEAAVSTFEQADMRVLSAWPAQLSVPQAADPAHWSLACTRDALVLRTGPFAGLGWRAPEDPAQRAEALRDLLTAATLTLPTPAGISAWMEDAGWEEPLREAAASQSISLHLAGPLEVAGSVVPDLMTGRAGASRRMLASFDARAWRVPVALAAACAVAGLVGLNLHWNQLARERDALRAAMEASFKGAFPGTQVVVDPVLQMNRQVAALRLRSGQSGPSDFLPLLGRLGEALGANGLDAIASMEYRDGRLKVRFRPERVDGRAARDQIRQACTRAGLKLEFDNDREPTAMVGVQG